MKADNFEAPFQLTEFEAYIIATAMQIAAEHTDASPETFRVQQRVMEFILWNWKEPSINAVTDNARVNIDVRQLNDFLADAQRYRALFDQRNLIAVHSIVERNKDEADIALDCLIRGNVRDLG